MPKWLLWLLDPCGYDFRYGDIVILEGAPHAHGEGRLQLRRIKRTDASAEQIAEFQQRLSALDKKAQ